jgi:hypothetical protein
MDVDKEQVYGRNWDEASLKKAQRELDNALMVRLIPERFQYGIYRIVMFLAEYDSGIVYDDSRDLTHVFHEIVNYPDADQYSENDTMGCIGLGSEFGVFDMHRHENTGDIHLAEIRLHAIPFLMSVWGDYELGLKVAMMLENRPTELGSAGYGLFGHWSRVARLMLAAAIPDGDVPLLGETVMQRFGELLTASGDFGLIDQFGTPDGFALVLERMTSLGLVRQASGKIHVQSDMAAVFLTNADDKPLLKKLANQG